MAIRTLLHEFRLGDVEDPEIYAAQPIWEWQQTEAGAWFNLVFLAKEKPASAGFFLTVDQCT